VCVPSDTNVDPASCGPGTVLVGGRCEPENPDTVCQPGTTIEEVLPDGTVVCIGVGGGGCDIITCGTPDGNKVSLCGQLYDVETNEKLVDPDMPSPAACTEFATTGPCSVDVRFFDPLAFVANPTGTAPLAFDSLEINRCGHFKGINVTRPFNGFMAVAVEDYGTFDSPPNPRQDVVRLTGIAFPIAPGVRRADLRAFSIRRTTDTAWTTSAGMPFGGQSIVDKGVYGPVYYHPSVNQGGMPQAGVTITRGGGTSAPDDYYFSDPDPFTRTTVAAAQTSTGANGMGLMANSGLVQHSAQGGTLPAMCSWQSELAASIGGVLFFRESFTHLTGDPEMACNP
jgi:hypothetical protein